MGSTGNDTVDDEHTRFREFSAWNQVVSLIILSTVIVIGFNANLFIIHCIYRKKIGTDYINPVLLAISIKNVIAIATCIPLAVMMLSFPVTILYNTCVIQENVTFVVLFAGFLFPSVLSIVQCDHILRQHNLLIGGKRIKFVLCFVSIASILLGIQAEIQTEDHHGCHLWSHRVDSVVLLYLYTFGLICFLALATMVICYVLIYRHASAAQTAVIRTLRGRHASGLENENESGKDNSVTSQRIDLTIIKTLRQKTSTAILKPMFGIVFTNALCSLPWVILYGVTLHDEHRYEKYSELRILTMAIMYVPIATDFVIFLAFSTKGRTAMRSIFRKNRSTVSPWTTNHR